MLLTGHVNSEPGHLASDKDPKQPVTGEYDIWLTTSGYCADTERAGLSTSFPVTATTTWRARLFHLLVASDAHLVITHLHLER